MKIKCLACEHPVYCFPSRFIDHEEVHHKLLQKIHEKIESLQNRMNALDRTHGIYEETEYQKYKEYQFELKSLLENEK